MLLLFLPTPCRISSSTSQRGGVPCCFFSFLLVLVAWGHQSDATSSLPHFVEHVQQPVLKAVRAVNGSTPVTAPARSTHGLAWRTRTPPPPARSTRGRAKSRWKTPARPRVRLLLRRQRLELLLCRLLRSEVPHVDPLGALVGEAGRAAWPLYSCWSSGSTKRVSGTGWPSGLTAQPVPLSGLYAVLVSFHSEQNPP
jgi:hypothetical protein